MCPRLDRNPRSSTLAISRDSMSCWHSRVLVETELCGIRFFFGMLTCKTSFFLYVWLSIRVGRPGRLANNSKSFAFGWIEISLFSNKIFTLPQCSSGVRCPPIAACVPPNLSRRSWWCSAVPQTMLDVQHIFHHDWAHDPIRVWFHTSRLSLLQNLMPLFWSCERYTLLSPWCN